MCLSECGNRPAVEKKNRTNVESYWPHSSHRCSWLMNWFRANKLNNVSCETGHFLIKSFHINWYNIERITKTKALAKRLSKSTSKREPMKRHGRIVSGNTVWEHQTKVRTSVPLLIWPFVHTNIYSFCHHSLSTWFIYVIFALRLTFSCSLSLSLSLYIFFMYIHHHSLCNVLSGRVNYWPSRLQEADLAFILSSIRTMCFHFEYHVLLFHYIRRLLIGIRSHGLLHVLLL